MTARLSILQNVDPYVGKYFSKRYVQEKVLMMSDEEIEDMQEEIEEEIEEIGDDAAQMGAQQTPQDQPQSKSVIPKPPGKTLSEEDNLLIKKMDQFIESRIGG